MGRMSSVPTWSIIWCITQQWKCEAQVIRKSNSWQTYEWNKKPGNAIHGTAHSFPNERLWICRIDVQLHGENSAFVEKIDLHR